MKWCLDGWFTAGEINHNVNHGGREIAEDYDREAYDIKN